MRTDSDIKQLGFNALAEKLDITEDATLDEIYSLMDGSIIEKAEITALYSRE